MRRLRALYARQREASGLSAGGLKAARRQVTLKPSATSITPQRKKGPRQQAGASLIAAVRAVTRRPSGRLARCGP